MENWTDKKESFEVVDVRKVNGVFLGGLLKRAAGMPVGEGLCVVQTFEPKPLYNSMEDMGFEHLTEKISDTEFRSYFYRTEMKKITFEGAGEMPFKPTAILNYKKIDDVLAGIAVDFWQLTWDKPNAAIELKTKLLLSLSNAVGAGRYRQATREMIKAYSLGVTIAELDELFELFAWNQGIGNFSSEIGPSPLFKAYWFIKQKEANGIQKPEIMKALLEQFGENNAEVHA